MVKNVENFVAQHKSSSSAGLPYGGPESTKKISNNFSWSTKILVQGTTHKQIKNDLPYFFCSYVFILFNTTIANHEERHQIYPAPDVFFNHSQIRLQNLYFFTVESPSVTQNYSIFSQKWAKLRHPFSSIIYRSNNLLPSDAWCKTMKNRVMVSQIQPVFYILIV